MSAPSETSTRYVILNAAVAVFLTSGYEAASTEAIAGVAKVARRTVFNQFGSKEALFRAAVERLWGRLGVGTVVQEQAMSTDARTGLSRIGMAIADFWVQSDIAPFVRLVIAEGDRFPFLRDTFASEGRLPAMMTLA